jgi:hypothetical protein
MSMDGGVRQYHCVRCLILVMICGACDRGNIYCGPACSGPARKESQKLSAQIYQKTRNGAILHAKRAKTHRLLKAKNNPKVEIVTHQGSPKLGAHDLLKAAVILPFTLNSMHCHFCGRACCEFVRVGFYKERGGSVRLKAMIWPQGP